MAPLFFSSPFLKFGNKVWNVETTRMILALRFLLMGRHNFHVFYVNSSSKILLPEILHPSLIYRMPGKCAKVKKSKRGDKEGTSENENNDKETSNNVTSSRKIVINSGKKDSDGQEKITNEDHVMERKKRKIERNGGEIKIISWNVAGLRAWIKKDGNSILVKENPDIVALQETKCVEIPNELQDGYYSFLNASEKSGHGGVLLLTKKEPIKVTCGFDDKSKFGVDDNGKGRIIVAEYENYYLINAYVPNSGRGLVNLDKRKVWDDYYFSFIKKLDSNKPVIYVGDLNVAHQEIDLANPKSNRNKTAGFTDQERNDFTRLLDAGFVDVFRRLNPKKEGAYTFWSNMHNAREKNVGWRLDYFVISERIMNKVKECDILHSVKGSDHCPLRLTIEL